VIELYHIFPLNCSNNWNGHQYSQAAILASINTVILLFKQVFFKLITVGGGTNLANSEYQPVIRKK